MSAIPRFVAMLSLPFLLFGFGPLAFAKTVQYNWDLTWVTAAPDGFSRPVIGINGAWPCPQVDVDVGDRMVVNVYNGWSFWYRSMSYSPRTIFHI